MKALLRKLRVVSVAAAFGAACLAIPDNADAAFLYWNSPQVQTASVRTCFSFANDTMRNLNFQNIRRAGNEVTGSSGNSYAAITCLGTTPRATAMVMVVGDDRDEVARVRDSLSNRITKITCFEGC